MSALPTDGEIADTIRDLLMKRGGGKSICPSDAARALASDWRPLMPEIRRVAAVLPEIEITQKGAPVTLEAARGPIRLRFAQEPD